MQSTVIEHHVSGLIKLGMFKHDYAVLALVRGYEVLIKPTPEEGIEIYSDYSLGTKDFAILHSGKTLEGFGTDFGVVELIDVLEALGRDLCNEGLVIDHVNGPGVPLSRDRFREICQETSSRKIGGQPCKTLDQWFATKVK